MTAPRKQCMAYLAIVAACCAMPAAAAVLTGVVQSRGAQDILTPPSMSSPVILRSFVEDGTQVKKGDPILSIDAGQAAQQLQQLRDQMVQTQTATDKEVADLELKRVDAELALNDARAAEATAAVDAKIPAKLISALDYDKHQNDYKSAQRETMLDAAKLADARAAVARRQHDGALSLRKLELQLAFFQAQVDAATVVATRDGMVVHDFQTMSINGSAPGRYEQGSTSYPGNRVGQVVDAGSHYDVRAWALQPDRQGLKVGQAVQLAFDALPGSRIEGRIRAISGATDSKPEWGDGQYYAVDITLDAKDKKLALLPGMSVRVETDAPSSAPPIGTRASASAPTARTLKVTGEIYAQQSVAITPPQIDGLWNMSITQMAGDGSKVHKGQPIVVFGGGDLMQQLPSAVSTLAEKKRTQEQLRLQLADQARDATLATAQAKADAEKAQRKAQQPKEFIAGIDYAKLVIDRGRAERKLALTTERQTVAAQSRKAQQAQADADVVQAQNEVKRLQQSVAQLTVLAPRDGIFLHQSTWQGDKIDIGSQVWRGMKVADLPDMNSLAVRASLPERDLSRVRVGQKVDVIMSGGAARHLRGSIREIGGSVHSKSRAEPVPVIDLTITLADAGSLDLKPGQPVRVEIPARKSNVSRTDTDTSETAP